MAVPSNPTVATVVTEGLKRGGRVNPSAADITYATDILLQEVKSDLYLKAKQHSSLLTQSIASTTQGVSRYNFPTACEAMRSVQLIDAPPSGSWYSVGQTGSTTTITLSSSFSATNDEVAGRFLFIVSGTGSGQFGQIKAYSDTTKIAIMESEWATLNSAWVSPDNTSVYFIESMRWKLWGYDKPVEWDSIHTPFTQCTPSTATTVNRQIWLNNAPDKTYVLLYDYWQALDQLDETDPVFLGHLRKFRNIWTQGIAVKTMQRYDEDRYNTEINVYNAMLDMYGSEAANVGQVTYRDVG